MFTPTERAAWEQKLEPGFKLTLIAYAQHACQHCGLAWPGISYLAELMTTTTDRARDRVRRLVEDGHLEVWSHPKGGKNCATVYLVLARQVKYRWDVHQGSGPCKQCQDNLRLTRPDPLRRVGVETAAPPEVIHIPPQAPGANPPHGGEGKALVERVEAREYTPRGGAGVDRGAGYPPHGAIDTLPTLPDAKSGNGLQRAPLRVSAQGEQSVEPRTVNARERARVGAAGGRMVSEHAVPDSRRSVGDMMRSLGVEPSPRMDSLFVEYSTAATAADQAEAQTPRQSRRTRPAAARASPRASPS